QPRSAHARHARVGTHVPAARRQESRLRSKVSREGRQVKRFWLLLVVLAAVRAPSRSFAQIEPPSVSASIQPRDVEVGEPFVVTLTVPVDSSAPSPTDPVRPLPDSLRSGPPSISSQTQISIVNGHMSRKSGITATWQVVASREGAFGLGPP